jgi:hypothetical protein
MYLSILKHTAHTFKKTQHNIIKINQLMLCQEITPVYTENYKKSINTKFRFTDC